MLQKKHLEGRKLEVTFRMPPLDGVVELYLCGDFNGWAVKGVPLSQEADGDWVARLILDAGKKYRFRYYDNQGVWHNDWEADAYVPNDFGSDDSVLDLTKSEAPSTSRAKAAPGARKAAAARNRAPSSSKKAAGNRRTKITR
jgi:1,4-alpha-glucan branching enzyme